MDWNLIKDLLSSFLGIVFLCLGLVYIPELRNRKILIIVLCVIMFGFGCEKIVRDRRTSNGQDIQRREDSIRITDLQTSINDLSAKYRSDTLAQATFLKELKTQYGIIKDPESNKPIINYTKINHADLVEIGKQSK